MTRLTVGRAAHQLRMKDATIVRLREKHAAAVAALQQELEDLRKECNELAFHAERALYLAEQNTKLRAECAALREQLKEQDKTPKKPKVRSRQDEAIDRLLAPAWQKEHFQTGFIR